MRLRLHLLIPALVAALACERAPSAHADSVDAAATPATPPASPQPAEEYPLLDSLPTLTPDSVAVSVVDSTGLGRVPLCAPLENVNLVFPHAIGVSIYCAEDGCDAAYPARIALTRAGDTLYFESSPSSDEINRNGRPLVHYAWTSSRRITSRLGVRTGMSVGEIVARGERVDVPAYEATEIDRGDGMLDTLREGPNALLLYLRREGIVGEVRDADSVAKYFTRNLRPRRPAREALDTAVRIDRIGVARETCR